MKILDTYLFHYDEIVHPYETDVYMRRWRIFYNKKIGGLRVHNIIKGDSDRHLHDHPFSFLSLIIKGGYVEQYGNKSIAHTRWAFIRRAAKSFHRIKQVQEDTWSVVLHGPVTNDWGFLVNKTKVSADTYFNQL